MNFPDIDTDELIDRVLLRQDSRQHQPDGTKTTMTFPSPTKKPPTTMTTPKGLERLFNDLQKEVRGLNRVVEHQAVQILNLSRWGIFKVYLASPRHIVYLWDFEIRSNAINFSKNIFNGLNNNRWKLLFRDCQIHLDGSVPDKRKSEHQRTQ